MKCYSLDLELNGESGEIIQIGIVQVDLKQGVTMNAANLYVDQPTLNLDQMLNNNVSLRNYLSPNFEQRYAQFKSSKEQAHESLRTFVATTEGKNCVLQWGNADFRLLQEQFPIAGWRPDLINVQKVYTRLLAPAIGIKRHGGLKSAVARLFPNTSYDAHDAWQDAIACSWVYQYMFDGLRIHGMLKREIEGGL